MTAPRLGWWWVAAPVLVLGVVLFVLDEVLLAGYMIAAGLGLAALLRLVLPTARSGGLAVRSRGVDVVTMAVLGLALAFITSVLDLTPAADRRLLRPGGHPGGLAGVRGDDLPAQQVRGRMTRAAAPPGTAAPRYAVWLGQPSRPRPRTASRSSSSSLTEASMRAREKSLISRPWTICQSPLLVVTGNDEMRPSGTP